MSKTIDDDMCSTVLPTPQWLEKLGQQIAVEYKLGTVEGIFISGMICAAIRKNTPKVTTLWIARDLDKQLKMFPSKPCLFFTGIWYVSGERLIPMPEKMFPQLTFENSPKRIELKIIDDE
jgi:hypothetical protein